MKGLANVATDVYNDAISCYNCDLYSGMTIPGGRCCQLPYTLQNKGAKVAYCILCERQLINYSDPCNLIQD